jgi:predicted RNA-binding Zn ribbon-like protein
MHAAANGNPEETREFTFLGESLALDLVNTEIVARGLPRDLLATPSDLAAWWREASASHPQEGLEPEISGELLDDAVLIRVRTFRAALRAIFSAAIEARSPDTADLEVLNRVLRAGYVVVAFDDTGQAQQRSGSHGVGPDALLLPIARSAMTLLTGRDRARLHRCANERCVLLFYDTTKSGTRRWCSTGCMNRARSSRRYHERREVELASSSE